MVQIKDKQSKQGNRIESPETNLIKYRHLISEKRQQSRAMWEEWDNWIAIQMGLGWKGDMHT